MNTRRKGNNWVGWLRLLLIAMVAGLGFSAAAQENNPLDPFSDTFGQRGVINLFATPGLVTVVGSLSNATLEADEPVIDGVSSGQTVWAQWTAPSNGIVTLGIEAETFSPLLAVYAGSAPLAQNPQGAFPDPGPVPSVFTNLSLVASNNYLICYEDGVCGCHWRERGSLTFHVVRGQDYQVCVDSAIITDASLQPPTAQPGVPVNLFDYVPVFTTNVPPGGDFILDLNFTPAPANDDFVNRHKLVGTRIATSASNAGATKEPGEPDHLGNSGGSSVWYSWTAPASGRVTITTNQVPPYAPPSSTDGGGLGVIITSTGWSPPTCGAEIDQNPPPVFYPVFAAYTGTAVAALIPADNLPMQLAAFPDGVEFDVLKGQTYQIAFDGNQGTTGEIPLDLELTTPPPNADPRHPIKLHGVSVTATGYNAGAVVPPGGLGFPMPQPIIVPVPPNFPTNIVIVTNIGINTNIFPFPIIPSEIPPTIISTPPAVGIGSPPAPQAVRPESITLGYHPYKAAWWSWTAPVTGTVTIDLTGSDYPFPVLVIAEPAPGKPAQPIETGLGKVSFEGVQGRTYLIQVGQTYEGLTGAIKLSLQGPLVDLPAMQVKRAGFGAVLSYSAAPGEVVALLYSTDNENWKIVQTATALSSDNPVKFFVTPAPAPSGPYYRAIIFDRVEEHGF
jgi:hypothetical protein